MIFNQCKLYTYTRYIYIIYYIYIYNISVLYIYIYNIYYICLGHIQHWSHHAVSWGNAHDENLRSHTATVSPCWYSYNLRGVSTFVTFFLALGISAMHMHWDNTESDRWLNSWGFQLHVHNLYVYTRFACIDMNVCMSLTVMVTTCWSRGPRNDWHMPSCDLLVTVRWENTNMLTRFATRCTQFVCIHTHTLGTNAAIDWCILEWGKRQLPPIGKSVSVSFRVRVVRACVRAKLCGCVRQVSPTLGARMERFPPPARVGDFHFLILYAWVLKEIHRYWQPLRGF